jgi:uncharacterized protein involved in outer membrane biogenesis
VSRSRPRPLHFLLLILGGLLLAILVCEALGWPFLRAPLEQQIATQLQRDVRLGGEFRLRLLGSIRLQVGRLEIGSTEWERARSGRPYFITATDSYLVLPYRSLFGRQGNTLLLHRLEVGGVDARLVRTADGRSNWRFETPAGARDESRASIEPAFVHLVVHRGRLTLDDAPNRLTLTAQARTEEGRATGTAGLTVSAEGNYHGQPFTAAARSPGILPLVAPRGRTAPVALRMDAQLVDPKRSDTTLHFDGSARDLLRFEGLSGQFRLRGPSLGTAGNLFAVTLPTTAPFVMEGRISKQASRWEVRVADFQVARTRLSGRFFYDTAAKRPQLRGELRGRQLVLEDLAPALGAAPERASSARTAPDRPATTNVLPRREFDIPALHRMDADVDVKLTRLDLGSERLKPLEPLQARLTLVQGVLTLDQLLARTADGELRGRIELDAREIATPRWQADLKWSGIRLGQWITARNRFAADAAKVSVGDSGRRADPPFVTGELAGRAVVTGAGRSTASMLGSLGGSVQLWVRKGEISHLLVEAIGLDIAQGLGLVLRGDSNIPMHCAAVSMKANGGTLRTEAGIIDTPDSMILLHGQVSLADERLGITLEARPYDRSLLSVRAPIHVRGSFADPSVRPDMSRLGRKAAVATVLGALLAPFAALVPLVDTGADTSGKGCAQTLAWLEQHATVPAAMKRALNDQNQK